MRYPLVITILVLFAMLALGQTTELPREKIYIQTNQPFYAKGDTVWFRCNLVDGTTGIPSTSPLFPKNRSKYVYIELHDCLADTLMSRHKIKADSSGVFANAIPLDYDIPAGYYMLVAYTRWMTNFSERDFAYKEFAVVGDTPLPIEQPSAADDLLSVKAYPEGGSLLTDRLQNLTFLITDTGHYPQQAEVRLLDAETDSIISTAETGAAGFGQLMFTPVGGRRYSLEAYTTSGKYGSTEITEIKDTGAAIHVKQRKGTIYIGIISKNLTPADLQLIISSKGHTSTMQPKGQDISINAATLPKGIVSLTLADTKTGQILSTRRFYNK